MTEKTGLDHARVEQERLATRVAIFCGASILASLATIGIFLQNGSGDLFESVSDATVIERIVLAALYLLTPVLAGAGGAWVYAETVGVRQQNRALRQTQELTRQELNSLTRALESQILAKISSISSFLPTVVWEASDDDRPGFKENLLSTISRSEQYYFVGLTGNGTGNKIRERHGMDIRLIVSSPDPKVNSDRSLAEVMMPGSYERYVSLSGHFEIARQVRFDTCREMWKIFHNARPHKAVRVAFGPIRSVRFEMFDNAFYRAAWTPVFSRKKYPATYRFDGPYAAQAKKEFETDMMTLRSTTIDVRSVVDEEDEFRQKLMSVGFDADIIEWAHEDSLKAQPCCYKSYEPTGAKK